MKQLRVRLADVRESTGRQIPFVAPHGDASAALADHRRRPRATSSAPAIPEAIFTTSNLETGDADGDRRDAATAREGGRALRSAAPPARLARRRARSPLAALPRRRARPPRRRRALRERAPPRRPPRVTGARCASRRAPAEVAAGSWIRLYAFEREPEPVRASTGARCSTRTPSSSRSRSPPWLTDAGQPREPARSPSRRALRAQLGDAGARRRPPPRPADERRRALRARPGAARALGRAFAAAARREALPGAGRAAARRRTPSRSRARSRASPHPARPRFGLVDRGRAGRASHCALPRARAAAAGRALVARRADHRAHPPAPRAARGRGARRWSATTSTARPSRRAPPPPPSASSSTPSSSRCRRSAGGRPSPSRPRLPADFEVADGSALHLPDPAARAGAEERPDGPELRRALRGPAAPRCAPSSRRAGRRAAPTPRSREREQVFAFRRRAIEAGYLARSIPQASTAAPSSPPTRWPPR